MGGARKNSTVCACIAATGLAFGCVAPFEPADAQQTAPAVAQASPAKTSALKRQAKPASPPAPTPRAKARQPAAPTAIAPAPAPKLSPLPPIDTSVPPPMLPRASRAQMRLCAEEWAKMKEKSKTGLPMWRDFAAGCLTR